jgi:putative endonuclease
MIPGFTKRYGIKQLVYFEQFGSPAGAIRREKQLKDYARVKKLALIESSNPEWLDLSAAWLTHAGPADPSLRSG